MWKTAKNIILILLVLALGGAAVLLVRARIQAQREEDLSGEWTAQLDMTEHAAVTALVWLQDIEAASVSLEDMLSYMPDLTMQVNLTLEQTERFKGTFRCGIPQEAYDTCSRAAYQGFAKAFRAVLAERLLLAGYAGSTEEAALEDLAEETFGMPLVSYLMSRGPALLPSPEELQGRYGGSGSYEAADGVFTRYFDGGSASGAPVSDPDASAVSGRYMKEGEVLILYGQESPLVYALRDPGKDGRK